MRIKIHSQNAVPFPINKSPVNFKESTVETFAASPSHNRAGNNYFSIFQHVIARNSKIKQLLIEYSKHSRQIRQDSPPISTNHFHHSVSKYEILQENEGRSQKTEYAQPTNRYGAHQSKWRENMMRRTNNGTYGKIIKGNPKEKHSCLVNLSQKQTKLQEDKRETHSLTNSKFMPVGKLYSENEKWVKSCHKAVTEGESESFCEKQNSQKSTVLSNMEHKIHKKVKKTIRTSDDQQTPKACMPLKQNFLIHKTIIPLRRYHQARTMTPKPWEENIH